MLTDIFADRYENKIITAGFSPNDERLKVQLFTLIQNDVAPVVGTDPKNDGAGMKFWKRLNQDLSMELGKMSLSRPANDFGRAYSEYKICGDWFLIKPHAHADGNKFMLERLSFVELAFRYRAEELTQRALAMSENPESDAERLMKALGRDLKEDFADEQANFQGAIDELNVRLSRAGYPLHYHNGFLQFSEDEVVQSEIEEPFWNLVSAPKWANVDEEMKRAIDLRDSGGADPAFYAARALESTIKIISEEKGWTHGGEKGAHNYIENLASKSNGRFIDAWEADTLKHFFTSVRNPFGHGSGSEPIHFLTGPQTNWSIAFCMASIQSLIARI